MKKDYQIEWASEIRSLHMDGKYEENTSCWCTSSIQFSLCTNGTIRQVTHAISPAPVGTAWLPSAWLMKSSVNDQSFAVSSFPVIFGSASPCLDRKGYLKIELKHLLVRHFVFILSSQQSSEVCFTSSLGGSRLGGVNQLAQVRLQNPSLILLENIWSFLNFLDFLCG